VVSADMVKHLLAVWNATMIQRAYDEAVAGARYSIAHLLDQVDDMVNERLKERIIREKRTAVDVAMWCLDLILDHTSVAAAQGEIKHKVAARQGPRTPRTPPSEERDVVVTRKRVQFVPEPNPPAAIDTVDDDVEGDRLDSYVKSISQLVQGHQKPKQGGAMEAEALAATLGMKTDDERLWARDISGVPRRQRGIGDKQDLQEPPRWALPRLAPMNKEQKQQWFAKHPDYNMRENLEEARQRALSKTYDSPDPPAPPIYGGKSRTSVRRASPPSQRPRYNPHDAFAATHPPLPNPSSSHDTRGSAQLLPATRILPELTSRDASLNPGLALRRQLVALGSGKPQAAPAQTKRLPALPKGTAMRTHSGR